MERLTGEEINKAIMCCKDLNGCTEKCPFYKYFQEGRDCDKIFGKYIEQYANYKTEQIFKETAKGILTYVGDIADDGDDRFRLKDYQWFADLCNRYGVKIEGK